MTSSPNTLEDGWIEWNGGDECPVPPETQVKVRYRTGEEQADEAGEFEGLWSDDGFIYDIIAYRVVQPEPGK